MSAAVAVDLLGWALAAAALGALGVHRRRLDARMALVAEASHELRGPLAAVSLGLASLARDAEPGRARQAAALESELRRAGLALADLAAAPEGRRCADRAGRVEVVGLLEDVWASWAAVAGAHGRRIVLDAPAEACVVLGDRERLAQAVGNLVSNALEHGEGPVRLRARRVASGVRIEVLDTGAGLAAPLASRRPHAGRRGHGLAVAGRVAERCGGRLSSERVVGGHLMALELPA
jgi:signal transduction histidine kinase